MLIGELSMRDKALKNHKTSYAPQLKTHGGYMVKRIVEQAKQVPINAVPIGWDSEEIIFPGVDTCLAIGVVGSSEAGKMLVGMHLGMFKGEYVKGNSALVDNAYLELCLYMMRAHFSLKCKKVKHIYIAGPFDFWRGSSELLSLFTIIKAKLEDWRKKTKAEIVVWDTSEVPGGTVDVHLVDDRMTFYGSGNKNEVAALAEKWV